MRRASELKGLPIVSQDTGKQIGEVKDVLLSLPYRRFMALLVDDRGWSKDAMVIPFESVISIGRDHVIVEGDNVAIKVSQRHDLMEAMKSRPEISEMKIYSEGVGFLGTLEDAVIDENTGEIKGYDICNYCDETAGGKRYVPPPEPFEVGEASV